MLLCGLCLSRATAGTPPLEKDFLESIRVVEDKDGYVNVRSAPSTSSKVLGRRTSGSAVFLSDLKADWARVEAVGGEDGLGCIHRSRLKPVTDWKQAAATVDGEKATAALAGFTATVSAARFLPGDHQITKEDDLVKSIDGHPVLGTDGGLPDKTLALTVSLEGKPLPLPAGATADLYQPGLESLVILAPPGKPGQAFVFMANSDGAGGYFVIWAFAGGKYVGRDIFVP